MKRAALTLLATVGLILYVAVPAQAAVPEQAQWTTVGHDCCS